MVKLCIFAKSNRRSARILVEETLNAAAISVLRQEGYESRSSCKSEIK